MTSFIQNRPKSVQEAIDYAFGKVSANTKSGWGHYNGDTRYGMCNLNEPLYVRRMISDGAKRGQKEFYLLDIGAGEFQWGKNIFDQIESDSHFPEGTKVHIISLRGEKYLGERVIKSDRCEVYNLGGFKVENLIETLSQEGLYIENKVDFAISRWCFRHLVDPVGTFAQLYQLLRPQNGIFAGDGFDFTVKGENLSNDDRMTRFLLESGARVVMREWDFAASLNHFIVQKTSNQPCHIPYSYSEVVVDDSFNVFGYGRSTSFTRTEDSRLAPPEIKYPGMVGSKELYEHLKQKELLLQHENWKAVDPSEEELPALHVAIKKSDLLSILKLVEDDGVDINESDLEGNTPLHLAVLLNDIDLFQFLITKGALHNLKNNQYRTPLMLACEKDLTGKFVEELLKIYPQDQKIDRRCLDLAIESTNIKAIEQLLKAGITVNITQYQDLENDEFKAVHLLLPEMWHQTEKGQAILQAIKDGTCVVLCVRGKPFWKFHKSPESFEKLILMETPFLNSYNDYIKNETEVEEEVLMEFNEKSFQSVEKLL